MFAAFLDSVKYVGHLIPIAFLRIFIGYYYLQQALQKFNTDFLNRPRLAAQIADVLPGLDAPIWYKGFVERLVIQNWQSFAFVILGIEFAIALSYLLGYVVRPVAILGVILSFNMLTLLGSATNDFYRSLIAIHFVLAWVGAGRCLGFDYYFFKRKRGIWW
jgi:thiosulfate dehydrogenase (quinone) large subunit